MSKLNLRNKDDIIIKTPWLLASPCHQQPRYCHCKIDESLTLGPNDVLIYLQTWPSMIQIMACHLFGTKSLSEPILAYFKFHTSRNIFLWNLNWNKTISIEWNEFENVVCKMVAILSLPQYVNFHDKMISTVVSVGRKYLEWKYYSTNSSFLLKYQHINGQTNIMTDQHILVSIYVYIYTS